MDKFEIAFKYFVIAFPAVFVVLFFIFLVTKATSIIAKLFEKNN